MSTNSKTTRRRILVIDVGGSHVKFRVNDGDIARFDSGPNLTGAQMARGVARLMPRSAYDAVSIGYPGLVFHNRIAADPHNLGKGWMHFDFAKALGKPVRMVNDAAMQAMGSYEGGRMLFLGLGTGLGATLIFDGLVEPMELGHMPYRHGRTFEDYVGERGRLRMGDKKWRRTVDDVVEQLCRALEVEYVIIGGGNSRRLKHMPRGARLGDNTNAFAGGLRLWESDTEPLIVKAPRVTRRARAARRPFGARRSNTNARSIASRRAATTSRAARKK